MSIKNALTNELISEVKVLETMTLGTEKYEIAVNGISKLAERIIEIEKLENEKQIQNTRTGVDFAKAVLGLGVATGIFVASVNFEKVGNLTLTGGKKALDQLLRFVKI